MTERNKGGRPRKYTDAQVQEAIDKVEARGDVADGLMVKEVLRDDLGISPGIDVGILDGEVRRICQARAEETARKLAAKLPAPVKDAAVEIGSDVTRAVTNVLATQFDLLCIESRKREAEMDADLRLFRTRVGELEEQTAKKDASLAEMEEENQMLKGHAAEKDAMIAGLKARIAAQDHEDELMAKVVAAMRTVIADNERKADDDPPSSSEHGVISK